jgi:hypothetical protein
VLCLLVLRFDRTLQKRLNRTFKDFLSHYGAVRHFGKNKDEKYYFMPDQLTLKKLDRFRRMAVEIWNVVIAMPGNEIEFRSISEVVKFKELERAPSYRS